MVAHCLQRVYSITKNKPESIPIQRLSLISRTALKDGIKDEIMAFWTVLSAEAI